RPKRLGGTDLLRAGRDQVRDGTHPRINEDGGALAELDLTIEEPEGLTDAQRGRPEGHPTAPPVHTARLPPHEVVTKGDHAARLVVGDLAEVAHFHPGRRDPAPA